MTRLALRSLLALTMEATPTVGIPLMRRSKPEVDWSWRSCETGMEETEEKPTVRQMMRMMERVSIVLDSAADEEVVG